MTGGKKENSGSRSVAQDEEQGTDFLRLSTVTICIEKVLYPSYIWTALSSHGTSKSINIRWRNKLHPILFSRITQWGMQSQLCRSANPGQKIDTVSLYILKFNPRKVDHVT